MSHRRQLGAAIGAMLFLSTFPSQAYRMFSGCSAGWPTNVINPVVMKFIPINFPVGNFWRVKAEEQLAEWSNVPGSKIAFSSTTDNDNTLDYSGDGNEVAWVSSLPGNARARTHYECTAGQVLTAADVAFNTSHRWTGDAGRYGGGANELYDPILDGFRYLSFQSIATHEFGHALGFDHDDGPLATLNTLHPHHGFTGDDRERRWLVGASDRVGLRNVNNYRGSGTSTDLSPTSVRRAGMADGGTRAHRTSAIVVPRLSSLSIEFGVENLGTENIPNPQVQLVLSTDRVITTQDIYLETVYFFNFPPGAVGEYSIPVTIPAGVTPGNYFVGFIVDPYNSISEQYEGVLNAMDLGTSITVQ